MQRPPSNQLHGFFLLALTLCGFVSAFAEVRAFQLGKPDNELLEVGIRFLPPVGWQKVKLPGAPSAVHFRHPNGKAILSVLLPRSINPVSVQITWMMLRTFKKPISEEETARSGMSGRIFTFQEKHSSGRIAKIRDYHFLKMVRCIV